MKIGFIGVGRMGRPMVARLAAAGHDVEVLDRNAVSEPADGVTQAEVVVVCVFSDEQVRHVCLDSTLLSAMRPGSALVVHTTASPITIAAVAARAGHVDVVDAPVSGGPHDVAAGNLTLFVGGADDAVARLRPVLSCYCDPILHVGPSGAGQKVKLVNNALFAGHIELLAESIRLGEQMGVPEATMLTALAHGSASSRVLDIVAATGSVASFIEVAGEFVAKDVAVVAAELGSGLGALEDVIKIVNFAGKV